MDPTSAKPFLQSQLGASVLSNGSNPQVTHYVSEKQVMQGYLHIIQLEAAVSSSL